MDGFGRRLRERALQLGLSDAEVARRAGLTATRYSHYVTDYREPDLATVVRICRVLGFGPDELLGYKRPSEYPSEDAARRATLIQFAETLDSSTLELALTVVRALAAVPPAPRRQKSLVSDAPPTSGRKRRASSVS